MVVFLLVKQILQTQMMNDDDDDDDNDDRGEKRSCAFVV